MNIKNQYKDESPMKTIENVRNKIREYNIFVHEEWHNIEQMSFSVTLYIQNTTFSVNGKGITPEFALASAYGELAERLSLLLPLRVSPFYKIFWNKIIKSLGNRDKYYFMENFDEWLDSDSAKTYFHQLLSTKSYEKVIRKWKETINKNSSMVICSKLRRLSIEKEKDDLDIPYVILDYYYGSNGMCAGNSKEEALVQGISEVIERYIQKKIFTLNLGNIYDITESCLYKCSYVKNIVQKLKEQYYNVTFLQCEVNRNISVIVCILKKRNGEYCVNFGCHPDIYIGIERTITELLQGYDMKYLDEAFVSGYTFLKKEENVKENYFESLISGKGLYPVEFILGIFPEKEIEDRVYLGENKVLLSNLIIDIENMGYKIYFYEGLNLGLYSYHIIIPGMSEAQLILTENKINSVYGDSIYIDIQHITRNHAGSLAKLYEVKFARGETTLEEILKFDLYQKISNTMTTLTGISMSLFLSMLYIKAQNWQRALIYIKKYQSELLHSSNADENDFNYYKIIEIILEMLVLGFKKAGIIKKLGLIDINRENLYEIIEMIVDGAHLFDEMPSLLPEVFIRENPKIKMIFDNECELAMNIINGEKENE